MNDLIRIKMLEDALEETLKLLFCVAPEKYATFHTVKMAKETLEKVKKHKVGPKLPGNKKNSLLRVLGKVDTHPGTRNPFVTKTAAECTLNNMLIQAANAEECMKEMRDNPNVASWEVWHG